MQGIDYAKQYLGYTETNDRSELINLFKLAHIDLDPVEQPWCAAFVNAMEHLAGNTGTGSPAARSFLNYGKSVTNDKGDYNAKEGDICVFARLGDNVHGHVCYFVEWNDENNTVKVLGGNQNNSVCYEYKPVTNLLDIRVR